MNMIKQNSKLITIIGSLCFIFYFTPQSYAIGEDLFHLFRLGIRLISVVSVMLYILFYKIDKQWLLFTLFYVDYYFISTILKQSDGSLGDCLLNCMTGIGFITLVKLISKINPRCMLLSFCIAGCIMCIIHIFSVFVYYNTTGGMRHGYIPYSLGYTTPTTQNWYFLTYDNESIFYFLPLSCILLVYGLIYSHKALVVDLLISLTIGYTYIDKDAATAAVAFTFFVISAFCIFLTRNIQGIPIGYKLSCLIGMGGSFIAVVGIGSGILSKIALFLGKDPTFTGRSYIWEKSIYWFLQNPILGNGVETEDTLYMKIGMNHCHNILLQILYNGGIICMILFILGIIFSSPKKSNVNIEKPLLVVYASIICFFVTASLDWSPTIPIPFILFLVIPVIEKSNNNMLMR